MLCINSVVLFYNIMFLQACIYRCMGVGNVYVSVKRICMHTHTGKFTGGFTGGQVVFTLSFQSKGFKASQW